MFDHKQALADLHTKLGYTRLNRALCKLEIVLGLTTAGSGLFLGEWTLARNTTDVQWSFVAAGLALFVLGSYFALAGHRSHLYQSGNELTAYLAEMIRHNDKGKRE
ncbi:MAG TPA: hypothetical protein VH592_00090 [Gemmataceae bacterium]|jgi:hypothetical protein